MSRFKENPYIPSMPEIWPGCWTFNCYNPFWNSNWKRCRYCDGKKLVSLSYKRCGKLPMRVWMECPECFDIEENRNCHSPRLEQPQHLQHQVTAPAEECTAHGAVQVTGPTAIALLQQHSTIALLVLLTLLDVIFIGALL